ncbi:monovalent cation/H+ antiporter subunit D [Chelatococcus composti]|jgi:Formate hydrogenlyase subunit 3/Multisubunit Na+/H+ antiporter, MnhD subunit|uniref:Multicomponent K+:H+ antiporter subunit D n=1 Tax=Chelatococcus composti TaxID=1743235 RepID=A0A841KBQ9_9HYPH|nr:monovalent cation/H+ antiporter subunit D [Chelatococcus composti]MBB6167436.1 multicomponent K+:H+ antiporter subunit D [Chelatococcus composti]MBS7735641.1 monovalent cation/H+ antiporter subunit D [Chelatococcus composti]PZN43432.1 MAG: monovalent cation/H+ antiporter subunit D [Pseudomonadota bacterium]GGG31910.1 monovalent cation/H+ antiporter subunit D [Chelatococcus composti]
MSHWIVVPTVLPALTAACLVLFARDNLFLQRVISVVATVALVVLTLGLYRLADDGELRVYLLSNWPAPFGILQVLDRLSATMLLLTACLALVVIVYAINGWDRRGRHFHPLFQFQLLGLNGAFLTGDFFNLFVFFEVMLIASYGLMLHGGGPRRLKAGFQYVTINLIGSTLFLIAVGIIYAVTGTLNMADLAVKASQVATGDVALLRTGALLLFMVFALKAAMVPLHWWLPTTYAAASAPVAALFAIMTKVGAYCILRMYGLVFGPDAGPLALVAEPWVIPAAMVTLAIGAIGVLASRRLLDLACFAAVASMGTLLIAIGLFDEVGVTAALYYLVHSTVAGAALFLLVDLIAIRRGKARDTLSAAAPFPRDYVYGALFFLAAIATVGLPPLSGFLGKLLLLDATMTTPHAAAIWTVVLGSSFLMLVGFSRAGSVLFWKSAAQPAPAAQEDVRRRAVPTLAAATLIGATVLLSVLAAPVSRALGETAHQALDTRGYVEAVIGTIKTASVTGL